MTESRKPLHPPPHLSMDEYADFVERSIRNADPAQVARQKQIEERITTPFSMSGDALKGRAMQARRT